MTLLFSPGAMESFKQHRITTQHVTHIAAGALASNAVLHMARCACDARVLQSDNTGVLSWVLPARMLRFDEQRLDFT